MIICPSCGSTVKGDLCLGCPSCGARAVGPPLAKAEHELPSFTRALIPLANGLVMAGTFLGLLIATLIEYKSSWFRFWTIVSAGEVAAWRLKWVALPLAVAILWTGGRIILSIKQNPSRFIGLRAARIGFVAAAIVTVLIATLIGITIPERVRQRQDSIDAGVYAHAYTINRALLQYREIHGTFPPEPDKYVEALRTVPDPDGSIAEALRYVDSNGYQAGSVVAAGPVKSKPLVARGGALRNAALSTNADPPAISFTNYELRLPGPDKTLNTDDDLIVRDGLVMTVVEYQSYVSSSHIRVP